MPLFAYNELTGKKISKHGLFYYLLALVLYLGFGIVYRRDKAAVHL